MNDYTKKCWLPCGFRGLILIAALLFAVMPVVGKAQSEPDKEFGLNEAIQMVRLSSPRATWESLIRLTKNYDHIIRSEGFTYDNRLHLQYLEEQIASCFDLRTIPPSTQVDIAMESAVYLAEVLARFPSIPLNQLPDRKQAFIDLNAGQPPVWRVSDTPITIILTQDGEFEGDFQFSARTIHVVESAYRYFSRLPYIDKEVEGFYEGYFLTPGPGIPQQWIRSLPVWMVNQYLGNSVWQWLGAGIGLVVLLLMLALLRWSVRWLTKNLSNFVGSVIRLLIPVCSICFAVFMAAVLDQHLFVTGILLTSVRFFEYVVVLISSVVIIISLGSVAVSWVESSHRLNNQLVDTALIRLFTRLISIALSVVLVLEGLQRMGFSLATVLAGAGVTGLAIALAAQESLRNIFGSIMLLLDKPFVVGQRVKIRGHDGVVENIGLRSTKIRLLSGHLSSIPNEDVARADIENIGERPFIRRTFAVTLPYDTSSDKIDEALVIVRDILGIEGADEQKRERNRHVNSPEHPPRVYFNEFNADSLNLLVMIWYKPADYWAYLAYCDQMNRELVRRFNAAGIKFALPAQTLYMAGDASHPLDVDVHPLAPQEHAPIHECPPGPMKN